MKTATIEILNEGEKVLGSPTYGQYMVREFDDEGEEMGGSFYETMDEAEAHVKNYQNTTQEKDNS